MLTRRVLALAATFALGGCATGAMPPVGSVIAPLSAPASSSRSTASALELPGNGVLALPGNGVLALPGNGVLALPGNGVLALPGNGVLALPGNGVLALPGADVSAVLGALLNALPVCAVTALVTKAAQCNALLNTAAGVIPLPLVPALLVPGLHPSDLQAAYHLAAGGRGQTVAVIDAGDDPTAESDLAVYRSVFGLPACTSASGCFRKVNQSGSSRSLPPVLAGWPQETGIDIEMVSAVCPSCKIVLVEANSAQISDLGAAVDSAAAMGANAISNSYYAPEYDGETDDEGHFNHPGTAITVSSGDTGFGTTFPASSRYVTAVGGTHLTHGGSRGWNESVWAATGSGCSTYIPKPAWQHDDGCANRTVADVAVVGDPQTGVAVYNATAASGQRGWGVYGGTSVGAPIVAAMYALAGNASGTHGAASAYANGGAFFPIATGNNGTCCPAYLCTAGAGYNGPGGMGSPNGVGGL
jgi:subtilase family serine protease